MCIRDRQLAQGPFAVREETRQVGKIRSKIDYQENTAYSVHYPHLGNEAADSAIAETVGSFIDTFLSDLADYRAPSPQERAVLTVDYESYRAGPVVSVVFHIEKMCIRDRPLLGYLADSKVPIKWIVLALMGGAIPVGFLVPPATSSSPLAAAAVLALAFFDQSLVTLLDSWTTQAAEKNARIVYSVARGIGAFTCAVAGFLVGRAISAWGEGTIFWLHAAFMAPALVAACLFASVPCKNRAGQRQGEGHYTFWQAGKALLKNRAFALLLGGLLLLNIGNRAVVTYLPMLIGQFGGTAGDQGMADVYKRQVSTVW